MSWWLFEYPAHHERGFIQHCVKAEYPENQPVYDAVLEFVNNM
jgi:hypothetical protein